MKPILEIIEQKAGQSFACKERLQPEFDIAWHVHPELQLSLFISGQGYRIVGDNISYLHPDDLVLVGSNLPHLWHHDDFGQKPLGNIHFITLNFREDFLGEPFLHLPEMKPVRTLFAHAKRGLQVNGQTRVLVAAKMKSIMSGSGLGRMIELLEILNLLAASSELEPVASVGFMPDVNLLDEQRLSQVCSYIIKHLDEELHRDELAKLVNLAPVSFSRYFKTRTGKTLPDFINELRIGRACRMLVEDQQSITDIAMGCGFSNLANFHRQFRKRMQLAPRDYRNLVNRVN